MAKKVSFGREAMDAMLRGLNVAAEAVGGTIGPKGRNVFITDTYTTRIINDGVSIANKVILKDPEEDAGAYVIRNVCSEQVEKVGDGTTTTAILTQSIIKECLARPENPMEVRNSLNSAVVGVFEALKASSHPITKDDVEQVALISAEDPKLAKIISDVVKQLGEKAVITVEDSKTLETEYEVVPGYEAPVGYLSPHFADPKTGKATLTDCPVLVTDRKISNITDIKPLFDMFAKNGIGSCVIACDDIEDSMLGLLVVNKLQGKFQALVIKAHGDTLRDIEGAVGATMVSAQSGITFQAITADHLGHASRVVADQHKTSFVVEGDAGIIYSDKLEREMELEDNIYRKKKLEERVAQLRGGIAVLRIAANTDFEREYLKLKAEDAVKAVGAALAEGIVEGGGFALWQIAQDIEPKTIGESILKKALVAPARRIIENGGEDYAEAIANVKARRATLKASGVSDPTKVERLAVANAVSAAGTFITSFCLITDIPDERKQ